MNITLIRSAGPRRTSTHFACCLYIATLAASLVFAAAASAAETPSPPSIVAAVAPPPMSNCRPVHLDHIEQQLLEKSAQGMDALRWYVYVIRSIRVFDLQEVSDWAARQRAADAACADSLSTATK